MRLSRYFDTKQDAKLVTVSDPTVEQLVRLTFACCQTDFIRDEFGPLIVTSGLRPKKDKYSQHEDGYALDIVPVKVKCEVVFKWIIENMDFDQVILETNEVGVQWIHVSFKAEDNRKETWIGYWDKVDKKMKYKPVEG